MALIVRSVVIFITLVGAAILVLDVGPHSPYTNILGLIIVWLTTLRPDGQEISS